MMISALGMGFAGELNVEKLRYHKVILMTDADIDGSHIQTLLLTFFYRHMRELIERGHLYLAQPPLYKIKRGKAERYIQTHADLARYLLDMGLGEAQVFVPGADMPIEETPLRSLMEQAQRCQRVAESMERRGIDSRLVESAATGAGLSAGDTYEDPAQREAFDRKIAVFLEAAYPETLPISIDWRHDEEHSRYTPIIRSLQSAIERTVELSTEILESPDYGRFVELGQRTTDIGGTPFRLVLGEITDEVPTARHLLLKLLDIGSRGQYVQRYKGLGEMNPEQLWETTMDPQRRQLLHVRIEDAVEADQVFTVLMGDQVEPRKEFIETNALNVVNLDV
jgi:DNA gyrase subunit B